MAKKASLVIVMDPGFTSRKDYCDLLYAWLISRAECDDSGNYKIMKKYCSFTDISTQLDGVMNRKTVGKYFNSLLELGLLREADDWYLFTPLTHNDGYTIDAGILDKLLSYKKRHLINLFCYMIRGWNIKKGTFIMTMKNVKTYLGIATSTTSNNNIVIDLLDLLVREGLIDCKMTFDPIKLHTYYQITKVRKRL